MKKIQLLLFAVCLFMLIAPTSVTAAVTEAQVGATVTMDGVTVGGLSSGTWRSNVETSVKIEADDDGNTVMKFPPSGNVTYIGFAGNPIKKGSIRINLKSTDAGSAELFYYSGGFGVTESGTPVTLKNGGAYVYDVSSGTKKEICFVENGTMTADTWYRVERIFDYSIPSVNKQKAFVYDDDGALIGQSPWTVCGTEPPHASYKSTFPSVGFKAVGFETGNGMWLDDLKKFNLQVTNISCSIELDESQKRFVVRFSEEMDISSLNKENITLSVNNADYVGEIEYSVSCDDDRKTVFVDYERLPFDEEIVLLVKKAVSTLDGWNITEEKTKTIHTPKDKFKINTSEILARTDGKFAKVTFENNDDMDRKFIVILARIDANGVINGVKSVSDTVNSGGTADIETDSIAVDEQEQLKLFVLDDWFNLTSIIN